MKNDELEQSDEMDNFIRNCVNDIPPVPYEFMLMTSERMLTRHHRKANRRLYAWGILYFFSGLIAVFGLSLLVNERMAISLVETLSAYKTLFIFGIAAIAAYHYLDKKLLNKLKHV